ncbi:hypothetical protein [Priestia aryabhattai]|uniref:hypothetical protein n=1 Tax=Priestia aryabhattai TaxID=412384 RepID=UPI001C8D0697|nr:hypothetical protein [Priestia aryabhattai]
MAVSSIYLWSGVVGHRKLNMGVPHTLLGVIVLKVLVFGVVWPLRNEQEPTGC